MGSLSILHILIENSTIKSHHYCKTGKTAGSLFSVHSPFPKHSLTKLPNAKALEFVHRKQVILYAYYFFSGEVLTVDSRVCCKKRQKKFMTSYILVCRIGDIEKLWIIPKPVTAHELFFFFFVHQSDSSTWYKKYNLLTINEL